MKKALLLVIVVLYCVNSFAQSANLDREAFHVSYVKLPKDPVLDDSRRTYSININGISIRGFSKVKSPGALDIKYLFLETIVSDVKIKKTKHEEKDDDGNVVSVTYTYNAISEFSSKATINLVNAITNQSYQKKFSSSTEYSSSSFNSYFKAERHYARNKYEIRSNHRSKHKSRIKATIKSYLNTRYGYVPHNKKGDFLWILSSKKHPEFQKNHEAYKQVKAIFTKMKYNEPIDKITKELEPVIAYFKNVIPRYKGTKRKIRKVKYASYYNLAKIYYYLDMPEKVKENAQKLIDNDYDKSDGKAFLRNANYLANSLEVNKMKSRHMKVVTEDISNMVEEEEKSPQLNINKNTNFESNKAYLITQKNDTVLVAINTSDIATIGYGIKTIQYDNNKTPIGSRVKKAKDCKELLFVNGIHFKKIKFKESSVKPEYVNLEQATLEGATDKLCKVLFESDKISLYQFNNKEFVIVPAGSEKGKSTSGMSFVFGFKKNLAKLAKECPAVAKRAKEYKNSEESLLQFCNDLTNCKAVESGE